MASIPAPVPSAAPAAARRVKRRTKAATMKASFAPIRRSTRITWALAARAAWAARVMTAPIVSVIRKIESQPSCSSRLAALTSGRRQRA